MKIALNPNTIQKADFETQLDACAQAGYEGFELMYPVLRDYLGSGHSLAGVKEMLADKGVKPIAVSIDSPFWQLEEGDVKSEAVARVSRCSEYCNVFGCDIVTVCSGLRSGTLERAAGDLAAICEIAKAHNVTICYEALGFAEKYRDIRNTLALLDKADCDNCGILLDSFHLHRGGSSLDDIDLIPTDRIILAHISDVRDVPVEEMVDLDRVFPGDGILDLRAFVGKLREKDYAGYVSLEIFNEAYWAEDPYVIARNGKTIVGKLLN